MITEMDIDVLPGTRGWGDADIRRREAADPAFNPYRDGLPPSVQAELAARYAAFFEMYSRHHDKIDRVTLWGLTDEGTWLNNFPIRGRTNHPLLFDSQSQPKPAFHSVVETLRTAAEKPVSGH
jgi:endo-1,4-beta-xylanase